MTSRCTGPGLALLPRPLHYMIGISGTTVPQSCYRNGDLSKPNASPKR